MKMPKWPVYGFLLGTTVGLAFFYCKKQGCSVEEAKTKINADINKTIASGRMKVDNIKKEIQTKK